MARTRLLIAEDDHEVAAVMRLACEAALEAEIVWVWTTPDALAALDEPSFRLALLDILMPGGPTFPVAERAASLDVPVILTTGHPEWASRCAEHGFPYLAKPFSLALLTEAASAAIADARRNVAQVRQACAAAARAREGSQQLAQRTERNIAAARLQLDRAQRQRKRKRDEEP